MRKLELFFYVGLMLVLANLFLFPEVRELNRHDFVQEGRFQIYMESDQPQLLFAGEALPLRSKKVMRRYEHEMAIHGQFNPSTIHLFRRANRWLPAMQQMLEKFDLPEDYQYIPIVESGLRNVVSPAGAAGFWQLMPETAIEFGLEVNDEVDERFHPMKSTWAACRYLKRSHKLLGNWTNVAAGYNLGINGLRRVMDHQEVESFYHLSTNKETSRYIYKLVAVKEIFEHAENYGYKEPEQYGSRREPYKTIKITESTSDLDSLARAEGISLKILKQFNPWLMGNSLTIKSEGRSYLLQIPKKPELYLEFADSIETDLTPVGADSVVTDSMRLRLKQKLKSDSNRKISNRSVHLTDSLEKLSEIAASYGVTTDELIRWNKLKDGEVKKGQRLIVKEPMAAKEENAAYPREGREKQQPKIAAKN